MNKAQRIILKKWSKVQLLHQRRDKQGAKERSFESDLYNQSPRMGS